MGAAVEPAALATCIRETLEMFLSDHPGMEETDVTIAAGDHADTIRVEVIGHVFDLVLVAPVPPAGTKVSDWAWWVGSAESVEADGTFDINECATRDDAIACGEAECAVGDAFFIVEARTRDLAPDIICQPFAAQRNRERFFINLDGVAKPSGVAVTEAL